jgi:hypothetical protein
VSSPLQTATCNVPEERGASLKRAGRWITGILFRFQAGSFQQPLNGALSQD